VKVLVAVLVVIFVVGACTWIPPQASAAQEYYDGAVHGCIRTFLRIAGTAPSDEAADDLLAFCNTMAEEVVGIRAAVDAEMSAPVLPTTVPGSTL